MMALTTLPSAHAETLASWTATNYYPGVGGIMPTACSEYNDYIYCVGGTSSSAFYASLSTSGIGTWGYLPTYPISSGNGGILGTSCVTSSGYIYCVGGFTQGSGGQEVNSAYYAQISSSGASAWTATTQYPINIADESCVSSGSYIYCVGGYGGYAYYASISSSGIGAWKLTTDYPTAIDLQSCLASGGYIYCIAGSSGSNSQDTGPNGVDAVYYAPMSSSGIGTWSSSTSYPDSVNALSCAVSSQSYIYCVGGEESSQQPVADVYYASISSSGVGAWTRTSSYPHVVEANQACVIAEGDIYCAGSNTSGPGSYYAAISSSPSTSITVDSQSTTGASLSGFRTVLYSFSGSVLAEDFTPNTFSVTAGQTYGVRAESYGSCTFTKWSDGVTSDPRTYTPTSSAATFTAVYNCTTGSSASVSSVNQDGSTITGYRTILYNSAGSIVAEGFTPNTFTTTVGQIYSIRAESYGSCTFAKWSDGVTSDPRTFTATASATASAAVFTAVYTCGTSHVTVDSVNQNGASITGFRTVLYSSRGSILDESFTPGTFTVTVGDTYGVRAESYGSCTFSHWSDSVTSDPRIFTATSSDVTYTAVYGCTA
jgi:hypothetical protein